MQFGTFHLNSVPPWANSNDVLEHELDQIVAADALGFDEAWLAEHNARRYGIVGNCLFTAAAAARITKRIRIGTAVVRLPLFHPVHMAEDLAYLDILTRGRLDWGVGKGYDQLEFSTYGVPFDEREERWQETFEAVLSMWRTGRTAHDGRFASAADAELFPRPLQKPTPPIYIMVSRSDETVRWAARRLYPMHIGQGPDWHDVKHKMDLYAETARDAGHGDEKIREALARCWQLKQMHVSTTTEQAIAEYRESFMWYYEFKSNRLMFGFTPEVQPYEHYLDHKSVLLGSAEKLANEIGEYAEFTGVRNLTCWFNCGYQPHGQVLGALARFSEDVIPKLRDVGAASYPGALPSHGDRVPDGAAYVAD